MLLKKFKTGHYPTLSALTRIGFDVKTRANTDIVVSKGDGQTDSPECIAKQTTEHLMAGWKTSKETTLCETR